jgi:hypothetical protein
MKWTAIPKVIAGAQQQQQQQWYGVLQECKYNYQKIPVLVVKPSTFSSDKEPQKSFICRVQTVPENQ